MAVFNSNRDRLGNKKTLVVSSMANPDANNQDEAKKFPIAGLVLLPSFGIVLIIVIALGFIYWRRNRLSGTASHSDSSLSDLEIISIPGLPVRLIMKTLWLQQKILELKSEVEASELYTKELCLTKPLWQSRRLPM